MTKEEVFQTTIDAWLNKDIIKFLSVLTKDILYTECTGHQYLGKSECEQWFQAWCEPEENQVNDWKVKETYFSGDIGFFTWTFDYHYQGKSGIFDGISLVKFTGDLICGIEEYQMNHQKIRPYESLEKS